MRLKKSTIRSLLIASSLLALAVLALTATARKWTRHAQPQAQNRPSDRRVTETLPLVISTVKGIEVVTAFIDAHEQVNIMIVNKTGKGITGLAVSSGNMLFSDDNGLLNDKPAVLIAPLSTYTFQQPISNLRADSPIRVSAAFFDDGTDAGESEARANVHQARDHEKEKRNDKLNPERGKLP